MHRHRTAADTTQMEVGWIVSHGDMDYSAIVLNINSASNNNNGRREDKVGDWIRKNEEKKETPNNRQKRTQCNTVDLIWHCLCDSESVRRPASVL